MDDSLVFSNMGKQFPVYGRSSSAASIKLSKLLVDRYRVKRCIITPSGMSAIATIFHGLIATSKCTFNIIHFEELYTDTLRLLKHLEIIYSHKIIVNSFSNPDQIEKHIQENKQDLIIIFAETCSNPNGYVFPFDLLAKWKSLGKVTITTIMDNTWMSSASCNPFLYGIDYVVTSLTKYYSAGQAIAGAILGNHMDSISEWHSVYGNHVSPHDIEIICNALGTLEKRISASSVKTLEIVKELEKRGMSVCHPGLLGHPCHKRAVGYFKYMPSVFIVNMDNVDRTKLCLLAGVHSYEIKTSFGGPMSRIDNWSVHADNKMAVRVSVGYEDEPQKTIDVLCSLSGGD